EIIDGMRNGDVNSLVTFMEENRRILLAFIEKRTGAQLQRKIEPEDILQEVSIEAVRSLDKVEMEDRNPLNWLFQLCERKIIDAHRRFFASQKRDASREAVIDAQSGAGGGLANLLIASMTTPSQAFSRDQKQLRMLAALDTLPDVQREALRLRYLVGLSSREIAHKLGKSDGSIRVMLSRGLGRLQDLLSDADASQRKP
ncbi:MAG: sigma-70 family RNA polymerase sigma factor, partial [Pirellulales bacterium]